MISRLDRAGQWGVWIAVAGVAALGPWFFGAWEMWWFWPFAALLSFGCICFGCRLLSGGTILARERLSMAAGIAATTIPFLIYAIYRGIASPVVMDSQRAVLLHASGMVAAVLTFSMERRHRVLLFCVLWGSLLLMAIYGILNHVFFQSSHVLWMPGYEQYAGRATGPYYCPDHYAGAMTLFFCMCAGLLLDRRLRFATLRWLGLFGLILSTVGILLSKSRGAGMTLVVVFCVALVWGFAQWPPRVRWWWRLVGSSSGLLILFLLLQAFPAYVERFVSYGGINQLQTDGEHPLHEAVWDRLRRTSRGRMYGGAWRACKTAPWMGIGPGMHQHLWPRFAATDDGDVDNALWPSLVNHDFHSYEVHSDWLQLLQEYGVVGFSLFLFPWTFFFYDLNRRIRQFTVEDVSLRRPRGVLGGDYALQLCGLLAFLCMSFYSLGDFNLQMPGTVWMFSALMGIALAAGTPEVSATFSRLDAPS